MQQGKKLVDTNLQVYIHLQILLYVTIDIVLCLAKHKFILVSPSLTQYHIYHSSLFLGLPVNSQWVSMPSSRGEAWWLQSIGSQRVRHNWSDLACKHAQWEACLSPLAIHLLIFSVPVISTLLAHIPWEITLSTRVQCLWAVSLAFSFRDSAHFQSHLGQQLFSSPLLMRLLDISTFQMMFLILIH